MRFSIKRIFGTLSLLSICVALGLLTNIPNYMKYKNGEIKDFDSVAAGALKDGDLVKGTIDMTLGPCAEQYSIKFGFRTSSKSNTLYYVVWMNNDNFIMYQTSKDAEFKKLDRLTEETNHYFETREDAEESSDLADVELPTSTLELEGVVKTSPADIDGYFREWFDDDETFNSRTERVLVSSAKFSSFLTNIIIGGVAAVLAVVFFILFILFWRREKHSYSGY